MRPLAVLLLLASAAPLCLSVPHMNAQGTAAQASSMPSPQAQIMPASPSAPADPFGALGLGLGLSAAPAINALTQPTLTPGMLQLMELESRFAAAVAAGGGGAFSSWFADDAVTLGNGRPPVIGKLAIAAQAQWDPKNYQLTWTTQGAQMGPSNDMGFTWGHYEGAGKDIHGQPVLQTGRYLTVWKKMSDGTWKVLLDASAEEPADAGACCRLPTP
jgi:ketosteroid isomerase-like protein